MFGVAGARHLTTTERASCLEFVPSEQKEYPHRCLKFPQLRPDLAGLLARIRAWRCKCPMGSGDQQFQSLGPESQWILNHRYPRPRATLSENQLGQGEPDPTN